MSDLIYKNYLFTCREWMVLAAFAGMKQGRLLFESEPEPLGRKELNLTVFQLYQKGILHWKDGGICELEPEIRLLLRDMKNAEKELQIYSKRKNSPLLCFWGDGTVVMEMSENEKGMLAVHRLERNGFLAELCDREILFPEMEEETEELLREKREAVLQEFRGKCMQLMAGENIRYEALLSFLQGQEEVVSVITVSGGKNKCSQGILFLLDCGVCDGMIYLTGNSFQTSRYSVDDVKTILMQ